jgi:lipopolysaccharide biosynthesis glycosyltransferase
MKIVFCADRGILAALHVAAKSVLEHFKGKPEFVVLTDELAASEIQTLGKTLDLTGKDYALDFLRIETKPFKNFPKLAGRHSTYFRLLIPDFISESSCLYLDSDIVCACDLSALANYELREHPVALVPEAPIEKSPDLLVFKQLGERAHGNYFNAGVSVINCERWRAENLKEQCFDFIADNQPAYWDQSALNFVLHGRVAELPRHYNRLSNVRSNWPHFRPPKSCSGQLVHFVDFPKPWSVLGRWVHPFGKLWWKLYKNTAHADTRVPIPYAFEWSSRTKVGYGKCLKDKILFSLYCRRLILPKGVPSQIP